MLEESFRKLLLSWFRDNARILPWRTQPSVYKTVVSEFMLQQTQVKTVLPFFERWMKAFPDFETLSKASELEVIQHWAGLGYYARAKNLHALAKIFIKNPPVKCHDLQKYKGIGLYTSAAISSIAFNEPIAVVDGNVIRVLARVFEQTQQFKNKEAAVKWCTGLAQQMLDPNYPGKFNEAIMELGATICSKHNPNCSHCPLKTLCKAYEHKTIDQCPQFLQIPRKKQCKQRLWFYVDHKLLLEPSRMGNRSLLELPEITPERLKFVQPLEEIFLGRRSISTTDYIEKIYRPKVDLPNLLNSPLFLSCKPYNFVALKDCPICGPHRKWIQQIMLSM